MPRLNTLKKLHIFRFTVIFNTTPITPRLKGKFVDFPTLTVCGGSLMLRMRGGQQMCLHGFPVFRVAVSWAWLYNI